MGCAAGVGSGAALEFTTLNRVVVIEELNLMRRVIDFESSI